jgi:hypothetical protein
MTSSEEFSEQKFDPITFINKHCSGSGNAGSEDERNRTLNLSELEMRLRLFQEDLINQLIEESKRSVKKVPQALVLIERLELECDSLLEKARLSKKRNDLTEVDISFLRDDL